MQRDEQRRRSRAAILEAAGASFERNGYAATSLAEVAAELGMVRGTVLFHFASKGGLVHALASHYHSTWDQTVATSMGGADTPSEGLRAFSHSFADTLRSDARLRGALRVSRERTELSGEGGPAQRWMRLFTDVLAAEHGKDASQALAGCIWGLLDLHLVGLLPDVHRSIDTTWVAFNASGGPPHGDRP